jgi:hypothetical protein
LNPPPKPVKDSSKAPQERQEALALLYDLVKVMVDAQKAINASKQSALTQEQVNYVLTSIRSSAADNGKLTTSNMGRFSAKILSDQDAAFNSIHDVLFK